MERRDRASAPAAAATIETALALSASIGMFMPSTAPELRGREKLAMCLQRFYTWACVTGCDSALDSDDHKNFWNSARRTREIIRSHVGTKVTTSMAITSEGSRKGN